MNFRRPGFGLLLAFIVPVAAALASWLLAGAAYAIGTSDGNIPIGTTTIPTSEFGVYGGATVGSGYVSTLAPTNGLLVQGNVGIGTTVPGATLDVQGGVNQVTFNSSGYITAQQYDSTWDAYLFALSGRQVFIGNGNTTYLYVGGGGYVGIGTTSPASPLSVNGGAALGSYAATNTAPTNGLIVSGNIGIGTASPSSTLQIGNTIVTGNQGTYTADQQQINDAPTATAPANSPIIAQYIAMQPAPASTSSVKYEGQNIDVSVPSSSSVTYSSLTGSQSGVTYAGGGSVSSNGTRANGNKHGLTGGYGVAQNSSSSATVGEAVGYLGVVNNNSTGTITFASGLAGSVSNNSTGTISNAYGVYSAADTNGAVGTITNGYGVYISGWGSVGGTWTNTPYDVYASDTTAYNYFAGNVGIGATLPGARTEIDTGATGTIGLLIKGVSGQTANLLNITDNFGNLYLAVTTTQIVGHEPIVASDFGIHSGVSYDLKIVNTTDIELLNSSSGTIPFYATGAGNVGIGITSPAALLNLGGNISASSWTTTGIDFATNAATYTDTSTAAAGTVTTRAVNSLGLPTLASTNAITVTNGSNLYIAGGAVQGSNTTLANSYGEYIAAGAVGAATNSYGLYVNAQTGATNNYAAVFASGNVGIGTTSPQSKLQISGGEVQVGSSGLSCTSNNAGAISYSSGALNYCNGSAWTSAGSGGGSGLPSGASQYQMIREGTSAPQWENAPYDVASFMPSTPIASSFINIVLPRNIQLPSGLPSSQCIAITAATASTTVTINKISGGTTTAEGTAVWAASAKTCTFTFSSSISFAAGDVVQFAFPSPADATLANVSITLAGIRQ